MWYYVPGVCGPVNAHCLIIGPVKRPVQNKRVKLLRFTWGMEHLNHVVPSGSKLPEIRQIQSRMMFCWYMIYSNLLWFIPNELTCINKSTVYRVIFALSNFCLCTFANCFAPSWIDQDTVVFKERLEFAYHAVLNSPADEGKSGKK